MNTTEIIVTLMGFGVIGWIVWYFWLWKGESVAAGVGAGGVQVVDVTVKGGYRPASINAEAGRPLRLSFTRREATPCGEEVVLPDFGRRAHLPQGETVSLEVTPPAPGEYEFTCGMNMYKGRIVVR
ncbi:MAG TPA: cupredoxin domain-containing protein [Pyrinomonadaceae bacterium]|nr:cupredoxin domain-containing protein [Pyrinomonadaceae bacterium]